MTDTGLSRIFTIDPRWSDRYEDDVSENTEHEWHYRLASSVVIEICNEEHSEFRWFTIDEAIETVWSWTNRKALQNLKAQLR